MTNQTTRVLELLKRFNDNQKICISTLQEEYLWEGKSEKTIRRDLDVIKEAFPDSFSLVAGEKGCYKALTKKSFENFLSPQNISLLVQMFGMAQQSEGFKNFDIASADKAILEKEIQKHKKLYEFKNKPFENKLSNNAIFSEIESAIYHQKSITFSYQTAKGTSKIEAKPYKILFMHENFYIAAETINQPYPFSLYRISKVSDFKESDKTFHKNPEISDFIADIQTPFSKYQPEYARFMIDVLLEVDKEKAYFFRSKNFLKSQKIIEEKENGNLLISYRITQELEIEELVKRWIPFVKVIEPVSLKERIEEDLKKYLTDTKKS